jgi:hypothetical protein
VSSQASLRLTMLRQLRFSLEFLTLEGLLDKLVKLGTLKPDDVKPLEQDPIRFRRR